MLPTPDDDAVLALTKQGERELHEAGTALEPHHLEALVLIDGESTVAQVLSRTHSVPAEVLRAVLRDLVDKGFVSAHSASVIDALDPGDFFTSGAAHAAIAEPGGAEHAEADANAEFLQHHGYFVNLARRAKARHEFAGGRKPLVLVVDDDPDICRLLQVYLKLEGIDTRSAGDREEILAELRRVPVPDLVMLDVRLADVNGFDVLASIRRHPVLAHIPVIMLTAEATREAVLRGVLGGADGYITKPFEIHPMTRAVKAVLGLAGDGSDQDWDYSL